MNNKLISIDLDGTLLDNDKRVSAENVKAATELVQRGAFIVPNTGRAYNEIPDFIKALPFVRYFIYSDGAVIYDTVTEEKLFTCLSLEDGESLIDTLHKYQTSLIVHHGGKTYVNGDENEDAFYDYYRVEESFRKIIYETATPVSDFWSFCRALDGIEMVCAFFASDKEKEACKAELEATKKLHVAASHPFNLELFSIEGGKGNALIKLADKLGIPCEATIAIGDSTNDSEMIKKAAVGLAVGNACDELKRIADRTVCKNTEHVLKFLLENY